MNGRARAEGSLLGLACGDALGRPVAGLSGRTVAREYGRVTEMRRGGTPPAAGAVTGATDLAVAAGRSLLEADGFDPTETARLLVDATAESDGVGAATSRALERLSRGHDPLDAGAAATDARPDHLCRAVPCALAYRDAPERRGRAVAAVASLTHADPASVEAAVALAHALAALLDGATPDDALAGALERASGRGAPPSVRTALAVAEDRAGPRDAPAAVDALWAALHHGLTADSTEESVVGAVNRGGAANVHGALAGAVAGAARGRRSLPDRWLDHLSVGPLRDLARRLEAGAFDGPRGRS